MKVHRMMACVAAVAFIGALVGCGSGGSGSGGNGGSGSGGSSITGRAVNSSGAPVSGAKVSLAPASASSRATPVETTTTDVNGNFTLTNVAAGTYTISVTETTNGGAPVTVLVTVTVPANTTINLTVDVTSSSSVGTANGSVFGHITDAVTSNAVGGVTVMLRPQSDSSLPNLRTTTDANGAFQFATVPTGLWLVSVQGGEIETTARSLVEVQSGAASQVDLVVALNNGNDNNGHN